MNSKQQTGTTTQGQGTKRTEENGTEIKYAFNNSDMIFIIMRTSPVKYFTLKA
jgi:hypothetical protein